MSKLNTVVLQGPLLEQSKGINAILHTANVDYGLLEDNPLPSPAGKTWNDYTQASFTGYASVDGVDLGGDTAETDGSYTWNGSLPLAKIWQATTSTPGKVVTAVAMRKSGATELFGFWPCGTLDMSKAGSAIIVQFLNFQQKNNGIYIATLQLSYAPAV